MRCYICDCEDENITYDPVLKEFMPCGVCQEAIAECLDEMEKEDDVCGE